MTLSESNLFDIQVVLLKEFFEKNDFEKKSLDSKKTRNISKGVGGGQLSRLEYSTLFNWPNSLSS